ncbi:MAG: hypothetical protein ACTTKX_05850 [Treponema sp.]
MKRFVLGKLFIISAALIVLSFISCNQNLKEENGMGKVVISLGNTARSLNPEGLPILDKDNTTIMINVGGESEHHHHTHRIYHSSKISVEFPIGTKITVNVNVSTPVGFLWRGEKSLTVAAGVNNVSLELSKTPSYVPGVGFSLNGEQLFIKIGSNGSNGIKHNLTVSKDFTPKIKQDGIGRVCVLYKDNTPAPATHLTRYTVEGEADTAFNDAVSKLSRQNQNFINNIENIAVDIETGNIFLIEKEGISSAGFRIYCITKEAKDFKYYSGNLSEVKVKAAAAYNGTLFLAGMKDNSTKLLAYITGLKTENNMLELKSAGTTVIENISPENTGKTDCNDIHADDTGVYVLLSSTSLKGNIYSVGQINRYKYDGENFEGKAKVGCVDKDKLQNGGIAFDGDKDYYSKFSKPVAFTSWNNDNLYIADDGINIVYKEASENFRVDGNKNRIATFIKGDNKLDFHLYANISSDTTWYEEYPKYEQPNTPVLSWEKGDGTTAVYGMKYWTSADGTEAFSNENKLWESTASSIKPTDIFCYDQDGNLYIFYKDGNYNIVRRFELKYDGKKISYDKEQYAELNISNEPTAIAVDISNGKNCLYYAYEDGNDYFIKKYNWLINFNEGAKDEDFEIKEIPPVSIITALAANKEGIFAAIKEENTHKKEYSLAIKKYKKENGDFSGSVNVVENEPSATSPAGGLHDEYNSEINALQIKGGSLYGIMSKEKRTERSGVGMCDFNNGSTLYGFGRTDKSFSESELINKSYNTTDKVGYGFYRFIAVQENKLVIASDGAAWLGQDSPPTAKNCNKVFVYEYEEDKKITTESNSACKLSKELDIAGTSLQWE